MPLAHFWSHLTKNATYGIARVISFDSNIVLKVKMFKDWGLDKYLPQLGKDLSSVGS